MLSHPSFYSILLLSISYQQAIAQSTTATTSSLTAGLSSGCQTAAGTLLATDFSSCANVIGLVSVIGAQGAVLEPLNTWISGICSASPCSNSTLSTTSATVNSGCSADVQKGVPSAIALSTVINNYDGVRKMLCTQYVSNSTFCVSSILGNVQTATGKNITLAEAQSLIVGGMGAMSLSSVPSSAYCTDCGHALLTQSAAVSVNTGSTNATTSSTGANAALAQTCGASFADGKLPSSVRIAGSSSASDNAKNSGGLRETVSYANIVSVGLLGLIGICIV